MQKYYGTSPFVISVNPPSPLLPPKLAAMIPPLPDVPTPPLEAPEPATPTALIGEPPTRPPSAATIPPTDD